MLSFIEKMQFSKSSSPDKEESSRDSKDANSDNDTCRASISQVGIIFILQSYVLYVMRMLLNILL